MRVVIFCDMEGVSCIETWEQVTGGTALYEECRKLYTDEMNAAVRGARAAGASEVVVVDCHGAGGAYNFKSFVPERLESGAQSPVTFKVELAAPERANDFMGRTGVTIEGPRTVVSTADTFWQAWDQFWYRR